MGFPLFSSLILVVLLFKPVICQEPNTDGYFISDFFQKMGLKSPQSYNLSSHVCTWQGVFCEQYTQNVVKFVASNLGLSGVIPDNTIGKLKSLEYLDVSDNQITHLPSDFWSLGSLEFLNLSHNLFSETLPTNIDNFGQLETLDLSQNSFFGNIPETFSSLASLQVLKLDQNFFESNIPLGILNCQSLVSIDLSSNQLNGTLPDGFGTAFPKLKSLNLARNGINDRATAFSGMMSVTYLNISQNQFQGSVVGIFQPSLEVIDLSKNQFQGHISQVNSDPSFDWSRLVYLDLSENELSGEFFSNLNDAHSLRNLNLANNRFSNQEFPDISRLTGLEYLNLSETNLMGSIPAMLSKLKSLKTLDVSRNQLSSQIPNLVSKNLQVLDVSFNNLSGEVPQTLIHKLQWMERFNFSYNNLSICASEISPETLQTAFIGSLNSCPIAANPDLFRKRSTHHRGFKLAVALAISLTFLLVGLLFLAFGCRRKTRMWVVKQHSYQEEQNISGPFEFQTDSTTWVADVKQATSVPIIIFEKPLLNFTFADLLSATSHFDRGTLLAEGRFGPVYRGFLPGNIQVAVKVLVHGSTMTDQEAAKEFEHLGRIKHPNLVPLTGYCLAGDQRIAIYEYMENGNLQNLLHDLPLGVQRPEDWSTDTWEMDENNENNGIQNIGHEGLNTNWRFRHKIALGSARALAFLHHGCFPPIIHRDVKASSIYLDSDLETRLSDFGLAKIFGNTIEDELVLGSSGYIPPEFHQPEMSSPRTPTPKSDVFGFGVILFELITGKKPVEDEYPGEKDVNLVTWVRGLVRKNQASSAIDSKIYESGFEKQMVEALKIGYLCTADLPSKRPSMQQVVGLLKDIEPVSPQ